jgi:presenilin-like A22 family membrane protease
MAQEPISDNPRKLSPLKALAPIGMMVALFILTIGLALIIAPLYLRQGLQAFGEEGASNPLIAVYYLVMILVVTGVILLLRKFLKKRKRKFLKYILGAAVLISTYAVIWPLLSAAVYGLPPEVEENKLSVKDPVDGFQPNILIYDGFFGDLLMEDVGSDKAGLVITDPAQSEPTFGLYDNVIYQRRGGNITFWTYRDAGPHKITTIKDTEPGSSIDSVFISDRDTSGKILLLGLRNVSEKRILLYDLSSDGPAPVELTDPEGFDLKFMNGPKSYDFAFSNDLIVEYVLDQKDRINITHTWDLNETVLWTNYHEYAATKTFLISTEGGLWKWEDPFTEPKKLSKEIFPDPSLVWLTMDEKGWEIVGIKGSTLYVITEDDESLWSISDYDYVMIHEDHPRGTLTVVSSEVVEQYSLPVLHNTTWIHLASFFFAAGLVVVLFIKPKWWIVDIAGILMGAGVLSLIGISLSILPILLFLILLAVYDAISVYKTKHMLTLAESVVESKLPILLVFPQKMGYRYEEEKDLLDKSRPRDALFMGLGDVIIPGTLIVSASTFLADRDGLSILGIAPQYIVVLMSFIWLLVG